MRKYWIEIELEKVSQSIQYGYTASSTSENVGPKFLRITDIQNRKVNWDEVPYCEIDPEKVEKYQLTKGDVLFARTGATVGKTFLIRGEVPASVFASYLIKVRTEKAILNDLFLSYFFDSPDYWIQITENQSGIGQPNVNGTKLGKLTIPIPPLPEQRAIVARIEELFSELDHAVTSLHAAQAKLEVYRQAVLKKGFEVNDDFQSLTVEECCSDIVDCLHSTAKFKPSGFYCIDTTCIEDSKISFEKARFVDEETYLDRIRRLKPIENDILFSREGTVGKAVIVPPKIDLCLGQRMMMFRLKNEIMPKFFQSYILSPGFKAQYKPLIGGTTSPHLNIRDIRKLIIPVFALETQNTIVQEIDSRLSVADKLAETIQTSLQKAEALRQSILKKAFEGRLLSEAEVETCRKEADWEPAERLLERIKCEKKMK